MSSGVSVHTLYAEHDPQERKIFGTIMMIVDDIKISVTSAALRVPLAVTWLTVYRQLHIPVKEPRPAAPSGKNVWQGDF